MEDGSQKPESEAVTAESPAVIENARDTKKRLWVVIEAGLERSSFPARDLLLRRDRPVQSVETSAGVVRLYVFRS